MTRRSYLASLGRPVPGLFNLLGETPAIPNMAGWWENFPFESHCQTVTSQSGAAGRPKWVSERSGSFTSGIAGETQRNLSELSVYVIDSFAKVSKDTTGKSLPYCARLPPNNTESSLLGRDAIGARRDSASDLLAHPHPLQRIPEECQTPPFGFDPVLPVCLLRTAKSGWEWCLRPSQSPIHC